MTRNTPSHRAAPFFALALLFACSRATSPSDRATTAVKSSNPPEPAAANDVFTLVEQLSATPRFHATALQRVVGVDLTSQPEDTQPYYWIDVGRADVGLVRRVELRTSKTEPEKALLIVDVAPSPCHEIGAFRERFGRETTFSPPSPHAPPDAPFYVEFPKARDAGKLTFGFTRGEPACLVSIVIDRIAPR